MYKNTNVLKPYANEKYMKKIHKVGVTRIQFFQIFCYAMYVMNINKILVKQCKNNSICSYFYQKTQKKIMKEGDETELR